MKAEYVGKKGTQRASLANITASLCLAKNYLVAAQARKDPSASLIPLRMEKRYVLD